jgi:hypothetical protein
VTWLAEAEAFAHDVAELGETCAVVMAATWRARADPETTIGLIRAALALGLTDPAIILRGVSPGPAIASDRQLLSHADDLDATAAEMLQTGRRMISACEADMVAARAAAAAARARAAQLDADGKHGMAAAATSAALAADADADAAEAAGAECEAALEILRDMAGRLDKAQGALSAVPDDVYTTYEPAYDLLAQGRELPHDGDFLTGTTTR